MFVDRAVGIDLGTTNSEIALLHPSERDLLIYADRFGRKTVPSAVAWDPKLEKLLVGHPARARRGKEPGPIESIKRKMGRAEKVTVGPHAFSPEEVSAKILVELKDRMREHLAGQAQEGVEMRVARAVVTVPAYFDAPQVEATRRAGELAGLEVAGILQEPTAAAIYQTWKNRLGDGNFLVYDLGGGTFDVSVLRCVGGEYQVLAIDGDNYLGGDDFDRRFAEWLRKKLVERGYALELDVRGDADDRARFARIVHLAQEIKESLSTSEVVNVSKSGFVDDKQGESVSFEAEIGRAEYEKAIGDLVETTVACCERALERSREVAQVGVDRIDHVILVGGSTRVPLVVRRVTEAVCARSKAGKPLQDEVDTCVALGAAVHAAQIGGLRLGDPDKRTVALFTTPLVGHGAKIRLGVKVEQAPGDTLPKSVAVTDAAGAIVAESPLGEGGATRLDVPLGPDPDNAAKLVMLAGGGATLGELPFALYRGDVRPRASALSRPSVVAKDIALEVVRGGRRDRKVLLARGTGLPTETDHKFFTVDQSGAVVLRILQNRLPIKTLVLEVPKELPVGSPVDLKIRCDEAMRMEARAVVGGQELWAQVEAPEVPRFDPKGSVEALLEEAEQAGRALWGHLGNAFRREADALVAGIREVSGTDPDKLEELCQRLRLLVDEYRGGTQEEMVPPMHRFEEVLDALRRVVYRAAASLVGMDRAAWDARLADIEQRAQKAYEEADGPTWRRTYNEVQALYETAHQEEFAAMKLDDPAYVQRRLASVSRWASHVEVALSDLVVATADEVRAMQLREKERLGGWLREKVKKPLEEVEANPAIDVNEARRRIEQAATELERIDAAMERIPSIGLVTDRGAS